jgi:hypothetical protein
MSTARIEVRPRQALPSAGSPRRELDPLSAVGVALALLLVGHGVIEGYLPFETLMLLLSASALLMSAFYILCVRGDVSGFLLVVFLCSHFVYLPARGGLFTLLTTIMVPAYLIYFKRKFALETPSRTVLLLVGTLWIANVVSLAGNGSIGLGSKVWSGLMFAGQQLAFLLAASIPLTRRRVRLFIRVMQAGVVLIFLVMLNQTLGLFPLRTPLLGVTPSPDAINAVVQRFHVGTFMHSELSGEYGAMVAAILTPLLATSVSFAGFRISRNSLALSIVIALGIITMSGARAATALAVAAIAFYLFYFLGSRMRSVDRRSGFFSRISLVILASAVLAASVGGAFLVKRLAGTAVTGLSVEGIVSGEGINRGVTTRIALVLLARNSGLLGAGLGTPDINRQAFSVVGGMPNYLDLHSLYWEAPLLLGWFGAACMALLWLLVLGRLLRQMRKGRRNTHPLLPVALGLVVMWCVFLVDQYKISMFRTPGYQVMIWTLLGFSVSVGRTLWRWQRRVAAGQAPEGQPGWDDPL